jgi:hypothetical protein
MMTPPAPGPPFYRSRRCDVSQQPNLFGDMDDGPSAPRYGAYGKSSTAVGAPWSREGTSRQAAESIVGALNALQAQLLALYRERGEHGATDEEVSESLGMNPSTVRPRRLELIGMGLVADSGRTRKTRSQRKAMVFVAVQ